MSTKVTQTATMPDAEALQQALAPIRRTTWRAGLVIPLVLAVVVVTLFATIGSAGAAAASGWLRVGHFAPGRGAVDVSVDGRIITQGLAFQEVMPYAQVTTGSHTVEVRASGQTAGSVLASAQVTLSPEGAATVVVSSGTNGLMATVYADDLSAPPAGMSKVRIIDVLRQSSPLDVFVTPAPSSAVIPTSAPAPAFAGVPFATATIYAALAAGSYEVDLKSASTHTLVLATHNWPAPGGGVVSVVVLAGAAGATLEVLRDSVVGPALMPPTSPLASTGAPLGAEAILGGLLILAGMRCVRVKRLAHG